MIDEIIFDLDGTLWDCRPQIAKAWNTAIRKHLDCDVVVTEDTFNHLLGLTNDIILAEIFPMLANDERTEMETYCCQELHKLLLKESGELYPGIPQMLEKLSGNHRLFIVSNSQKGYIETFLEATNFGKYFTGFLCYGDTKKPKGENICGVIEKYGLKNPIYVGDMKADGEAASYANIPIIYVTYGFGVIYNADYVADTAEDIERIVNS